VQKIDIVEDVMYCNGVHIHLYVLSKRVLLPYVLYYDCYVLKGDTGVLLKIPTILSQK